MAAAVPSAKLCTLLHDLIRFSHVQFSHARKRMQHIHAFPHKAFAAMQLPRGKLAIAAGPFQNKRRPRCPLLPCRMYTLDCACSTPSLLGCQRLDGETHCMGAEGGGSAGCSEEGAGGAGDSPDPPHLPGGAPRDPGRHCLRLQCLPWLHQGAQQALHLVWAGASTGVRLNWQ